MPAEHERRKRRGYGATAPNPHPPAGRAPRGADVRERGAGPYVCRRTAAQARRSGEPASLLVFSATPLIAVVFMVLGGRSVPGGDRLRGLGLHRLGLRVWWIASLITLLTSVVACVAVVRGGLADFVAPSNGI